MKKHFLNIFIIMLAGVFCYSEGCASTQKSRHQAKSTPNANTIKEKNNLKFAALKKYNLPPEQYAIMGSGPLGIRNLREVRDIDIMVSPELRDVLIERYGMSDDGKVKKIIFPDDDIEAFWEGSFYTQQRDKDTPSVAEQITNADIIEGLPFQPLKDVVYFKRKMNRAKDLEDIKMIEEWQRVQLRQESK